MGPCLQPCVLCVLTEHEAFHGAECLQLILDWKNTLSSLNPLSLSHGFTQAV